MTLAPDALGRQTFQIVGVLPADFVFPDIVNRPPDFLTPIAIDPGMRGNPRGSTELFARLAPGVEPPAATAEMQASWIAAVRASRVSPVDVLHAD